eukprot:3109294-Rhodomonas_salina.3
MKGEGWRGEEPVWHHDAAKESCGSRVKTIWEQTHHDNEPVPMPMLLLRFAAAGDAADDTRRRTLPLISMIVAKSGT